MSVESQTTKKFFLGRKFAKSTKHTETLYKAQPKYYKPIQKPAKVILTYKSRLKNKKVKKPVVFPEKENPLI